MTFYNREGKEISLLEWGRLYETTSYRFIEHAVVVDNARPSRGFQVTTIWLGNDDETDPSGMPPIFETMVFRLRHDGKHSVFEARYLTEARARKGHETVLAEVVGDMKEPVVSYPLAPWVPEFHNQDI
jgi:hypothetical protein